MPNSTKSSSSSRRLPLAALAAAVYVPLLLTAPGRVGADTKSYLYLDPARLLSRAWSMWDPSIGAGTVSHQNIGYLWPMGPWYWTFERLGVPDWIAQRLWLGTILFAAGAGTLWLLRSVLGWTTTAATVAAFAYACTPYSLTLAARISVILLPFAGLPWLVGLAARSVRRGGWRDPACFALVVATVGSVNATALVLAGLGPLLWLARTWWVGEATAGRLAGVVARIGLLTVAANLWWLVGLWAQGGYGIEILRYTETAEVVASASNAAEVLRGLGYWFFYGGDRLGPWIEAGSAYTQRLPLLALTFALPMLALAGLARFGRRRPDRDAGFFVALLAVGVVAAVGAHPWDRGPVGASAIQSFLLSDLGLAMRSLPRAVPLVALATAAGLGLLAEAAGTRARPVGLALCVAAYAALPPLWTGGLVADNLDRPETLPSYWLDAAAHLDAAGNATRVLEVPGVDFATYRWGNTVDPVTPGLMDRPYLARELIPYGSAASADLLNALDRRLQEGTLEPGVLAAVARRLGVGDVVLRDDLQFERHRTPRPYVLAPFLATEPGLDLDATFGEPTVNTPSALAPLVDDLALVADDGVARPPVEVYAVEDPSPIVHAVDPGGVVVLAGDGEGLVDAALLLGDDSLVLYGADLGAAGVAEALDAGAPLVITDGNRAQGRRWSTVRDTLGFVEGTPVLEDDLTDNRLPLFPDAEDGWQTTAALPSNLTVSSSSYGNPISFTPEYRPTNAADGDLTTEWRTGASADVRGERLRISGYGGTTASRLRIVQQLTGARNRHITSIELRLDESEPQEFLLEESSLEPSGQVLDLDVPPGGFDSIEIEIVADSSGRGGAWGRPVRFNGLSQVGFAEVALEGGPTGGPEALVLPTAATAAIGPDTPVALVLTRWRTDPTESVRDDPEPGLTRRLTLPVDRTFDVWGTARTSPRAPDDRLDGTVNSSSHLAGTIEHRGAAAFDGDPSTWWSPAFGDPAPSITVTATTPVSVDEVDVGLLDDPRRSVLTRLGVSVDGGAPVVVDVPAGGGNVSLGTTLTGTTFRFELVAVEARSTIEWFSNTPVVVPPAVTELAVPGLSSSPIEPEPGCRADLVTVDGEPLPVRLLDGDRLEACEPLALAAGDHEVATVPGRRSGIDVDQLVLGSGYAAPEPAAPPVVTVASEGRATVDVRVEGATPGEPFWLVLGQSHNAGWELDGQGQGRLVDGYANGWLVTPDATNLDLHLEWVPQRTVTRALFLSAAAVLGCVALALLPRRRTTSPASAGTRRALHPAVAVGALAVGTIAFVGPVAAALVVAATFLVPARLRPWLPPATYAAAAGYILLRQAVSRPTAAFEWPAEQAAAHQPALAAVALLVALWLTRRTRPA